MNLAIWWVKRWDSVSCFLVSVTCSTFTAHMSPPFSKRWIVNLYNHLRSYITNLWKEMKVAYLFPLWGGDCSHLSNAIDLTHNLGHNANKPSAPLNRLCTRSHSSNPTYLFRGRLSFGTSPWNCTMFSVRARLLCLQPRKTASRDYFELRGMLDSIRGVEPLSPSVSKEWSFLLMHIPVMLYTTVLLLLQLVNTKSLTLHHN